MARRFAFIEFETTVVSNFLGRGDPCTRYLNYDAAGCSYR